MYKNKMMRVTTLRKNDTVEGESIEMKVERIITQNEPIKDGAPIIYTERKEGVLPQYDIRTDRFEYAIDAMDKVSKTYTAMRENAIRERESSGDMSGPNGGETKE